MSFRPPLLLEINRSKPPGYTQAAWHYELLHELFLALEDLTLRCDGDEGVRADGSNIDTCQAHAALARVRGKENT